MYLSRKIIIGGLAVGGNSPISVQSMTNAHTSDTKATVEQVISLVEAGCHLVRVTTQNIAEAENLRAIKQELIKRKVNVPIIADIHFNKKVAEVAALYADKVRVNPGNYYSQNNELDNLSAIEKNLSPLLSICKENNTVIRIGVNHGSLSKRILEKYGDTPLGMVESLMEFVEVCKKYDFHNLVLSVKTSNVQVMIEANELLVERLVSEGLDYPVHLGVTEAGGDDEGRIKSAAGIGYLLSRGVGDTIRVSLSEDPVNEVPVALMLANFFAKGKVGNIQIPKQSNIDLPNKEKKPLVISEGETASSDAILNTVGNDKLIVFTYPGYTFEETRIAASVDMVSWFRDNTTDAVLIKNDYLTDDVLANLTKEILQAIGIRYFRTEYIACPTCGRTNLNLVKLLKEVKEKTHSQVGLKIAVMGCRVNGPGEMQGVDYGIVGRGNGTVNLYKNGEIHNRRIPQEEAVDALVELIKVSGDWH